MERDALGRFAPKSGPLVEVSKAPSFPSGVGINSRPLGSTGLKRSYGVIYEEFLKDLQGEKANRIFKEMADNDPIVGSVLFAIEMFLRGVKWFVDPHEDDENTGEEKAKYLRECKEDMSHTWADFISEVMSMLQHGWSWLEILYKVRTQELKDDGDPQSNFNDGKIGWRKFEIRSQDSWDRWDFDDEGGIRGMFQRAAPDYEERYIPIQKSLLFRTTTRKNNPEGRSVLRNAYRPWYFKKRIEEIEGIGIERDLAGLPFAEVPAEMMREDANEADKATLASIVELVKNIRRDEQEGVVWPQSLDEKGNKLYTFSLMNSGGTRQFSTDTTITRYESRIAMTVLADFILLGSDTQGSFAMSVNKSGLFQAVLSAWLDVVQGVLNDYAVPRLFRLNNDHSGVYPKFRHDEVQKPALADLATFVSALVGAGAQLFPDVNLENHFRRVAQLPLRDIPEGAEEKEDELRDEKVEAEIEAARAAIEGGKLGIAGQKKALAEPSTLGKQPGSVPGAPTKSTGRVKSKLPPQSRRRTAAVNASENVRKRVVKRAKQPEGYVIETEKIRINREKPENKKRHRFKAAEWTFPNGHPRCIRCGDEEMIGGVCQP